MYKQFLISLTLLLPFNAYASGDLAHRKIAEIRTIYVPAFRTYFANEYKLSERNVAFLKSISAKMGPFHLSIGSSQTTDVRYCRASYPIYMPGKVTYESFLAEAMKAEMAEAGMITEAVGAPVVMSITTMDFTSFGTGKWSIEAMVSTQGDNNLVIKHEVEFPVSLEAGAACGQVARALVSTMQEFFYLIYSSAVFQGHEKSTADLQSLVPTSVPP